MAVLRILQTGSFLEKLGKMGSFFQPKTGQKNGKIRIFQEKPRRLEDFLFHLGVFTVLLYHLVHL